MNTMHLANAVVVEKGPSDKQPALKQLTGQALHLGRLAKDVPGRIVGHRGDFVLVQGHFSMSLSDYHHGVCAITANRSGLPGVSKFTVVTGTALPRNKGKGMAYRKLTPANEAILEGLLAGEIGWTPASPAVQQYEP